MLLQLLFFILNPTQKYVSDSPSIGGSRRQYCHISLSHHVVQIVSHLDDFELKVSQNEAWGLCA